MFVTELGMYSDVKPEHPLNTEFPKVVIDVLSVSDVIALHPAKALYPSEVIELGKTIDVNAEQLENA